MLRAYRRFRRNLLDRGARVALWRACVQVLAPVYLHRVYRVYRIDLLTWQPREPLRDGLQYRLLTRDDTDVIAGIEDIEEWLQGAVEQRLRNGSTCLIAMDGPRLAGFNLTSFGQISIPLLEKTWTLRPDCAWSEQITVARSHRGRGVASELRYRMFTELRARGIKRFYGDTLSANKSSLGLTRKVGFSEILDIHYRRVLGAMSAAEFARSGDNLQRVEPRSTSR